MEQNMILLYLMVGILIIVALVQVVRAVVRLLDPNYRRSLKVRRMASLPSEEGPQAGQVRRN